MTSAICCVSMGAVDSPWLMTGPSVLGRTARGGYSNKNSWVSGESIAFLVLQFAFFY